MIMSSNSVIFMGWLAPQGLGHHGGFLGYKIYIYISFKSFQKSGFMPHGLSHCDLYYSMRKECQYFLDRWRSMKALCDLVYFQYPFEFVNDRVKLT